MPNVTIFVQQGRMPQELEREKITADISDLCTGVLKAAPDKVHIIYVEVLRGRGNPAYVEVKYRLETFRTPPIMQEFLTGVDAALVSHAGLKSRIRCFGYGAEAIYAKS